MKSSQIKDVVIGLAFRPQNLRTLLWEIYLGLKTLLSGKFCGLTIDLPVYLSQDQFAFNHYFLAFYNLLFSINMLEYNNIKFFCASLAAERHVKLSARHNVFSSMIQTGHTRLFVNC